MCPPSGGVNGNLSNGDVVELTATRRTRSSGLKGTVAALLGGAVFVTTALAGVVGPAAAAPLPTKPGNWAPLVQSSTNYHAGRYIVLLDDQPAATYDGGVDGLQATQSKGKQLNARSAPVQDYSQYLEGKQDDAAAAVGASVDQSYTVTLNGFSAALDPAQAKAISQQQGVLALVPDEMAHPDATPSTTFLGLDGAGGVWDKLGGVGNAGKGVVVGDIDTGIAPEHPSFAGDPLGTTDGDAPYLNGSTITFHKADGNTFTGICQTGVQFTAADCSTKIIGARYYVDGFGEKNLGSVAQGEYVSPRDGDGHGSHTASTAAGNNGVESSVLDRSFGDISGVAPAAKIAAYKVCWSGPDPTVTTDDGCTTADMLKAIDDATKDGVDVINFSIGGSAAATTVSLTDQAFLSAATAGIFVSASAGNSGPAPSTLDNASPWYTTVAASTIPSYEATATLGNGSAFAGASITAPKEPLTGPFVRADNVGNGSTTAADTLLCAPGSLDPTKVAGTIVFCQRGVYARTDKSAEVKRAGGIGMVLVNKTPSSLDTDAHAVPTVHLQNTAWDATYAYSATPGATVTLQDGNLTGIEPATPQVAGFSSRGPVEADGSDILKPDITAPGVAILAAGANAEGEKPSFEFLSGTSMAAPHITGTAALYLSVHPKATPAEIKSALMTTAYDTVDANGAPVTDPFTQGAGHEDPTKMFSPGLLYLNGPADWLAYIKGAGYSGSSLNGVTAIDPSDLNLASIAIGSLAGTQTVTRTVTSTQAGTFTASTAGLDGVDVAVTPSTLTFGAAGETQSYTVTFTRTDAALDTFATGSLSWTSGDVVARSPIAVRPVAVAAPESVSGTGINGSVDVTVTPGETGELPLATAGLAPGVIVPDPTGAAAPHSGSGKAKDSFHYTTTIADGLAMARFDLDALDNKADLDLTVTHLDADGNADEQYVSATASGDERVDIPNPTAGTYDVKVDVFSIPEGSDSTAWDLRTFQVVPGSGDGAFTVNPTVLNTVQGTPATYTASWTGLAPETLYLGLVSYGDTGLFTKVNVASGEAPAPGAPVNTAPPTISGTPAVGSTLTASPGTWDTDGLTFAYQWQRGGVDIAGATSATYVVTKADQGASLTVVVTASAADRPSGTATSDAVMVPYGSTISLKLSTPVSLSFLTVKARITVASQGDVAGQPVKVKVGGKTVTGVLDSAGKVTLTLPKLGRGVYSVKASFAGTPEVSGSKSAASYLVILF
ncbi:serine protease [Glaciibacter flavus]|uniref:Serine protease n=1 Tax=Orlajensenia flava TaxID=2565934 RepID=A0A4S4FZC0_9MICO|nr:serine protease [Glaciibacter flavus]